MAYMLMYGKNPFKNLHQNQKADDLWIWYVKFGMRGLPSLFKLGPSINGLVTDGNAKLCSRGFVKYWVNRFDSEHTRDYTKFYPVCKVKILQVTVKH